MSRQTIAIVLGAVIIFGAVVVGTLAATNGGSDAPVHTLENGQIHTGELETEPMEDDGMGMMDHDGGSMP